MQLNKDDLKGFYARLECSLERWRVRARPNCGDGLVLYCFTACVRPFVLYIEGPVFAFAMRLLGPLSVYITRHEPRAVDAAYRWASDMYKIVMDVCLCGAYVVVAVIVRQSVGSALATWGIACGALCGLYRLLAVTVVAALLSFDKEYVIRNPRRAVVNTLWHYFEIALAYGTLYLAVEFMYRGTFVGPGGHAITENMLCAFYFSVITLATVGYGDYVPTNGSLLGMSLVLSEVGCGMFMILVVLQRSLAMAFGGPRAGEDGSR